MRWGSGAIAPNRETATRFIRCDKPARVYFLKGGYRECESCFADRGANLDSGEWAEFDPGSPPERCDKPLGWVGMGPDDDRLPRWAKEKVEKELDG